MTVVSGLSNSKTLTLEELAQVVEQSQAKRVFDYLAALSLQG